METQMHSFHCSGKPLHQYAVVEEPLQFARTRREVHGHEPARTHGAGAEDSVRKPAWALRCFVGPAAFAADRVAAYYR
jgi:hypothetical protein